MKIQMIHSLPDAAARRDVDEIGLVQQFLEQRLKLAGEMRDGITAGERGIADHRVNLAEQLGEQRGLRRGAAILKTCRRQIANGSDLRSGRAEEKLANLRLKLRVGTGLDHGAFNDAGVARA